MLFVIAIAFPNIILYVLMVRSWRRTLREKPDFRLNFGLMDLLASTFCISPTLWLLTIAAQQDSRNVLSMVLIGAVVVPYQVCGMVYMFFHKDRFPFRASHSAGSAFVSAIVGAFAGIIMLVYVLSGVALLLIALGTFVATLPYSLPVIPIGVLAYILRNRRHGSTIRSNADPVSSTSNKTHCDPYNRIDHDI